MWAWQERVGGGGGGGGGGGLRGRLIPQCTLCCVYLSEVIQTSLLCRLQKKSLEHNDCLYVVSVCIGTESENVLSLQSYFPTNSQIVIPMLLNHWNNTRAICLNVI